MPSIDSENDYCVVMRRRPPKVRDGEPVLLLPRSLIENNDEIALGARLVCNRRLFGECYRQLMPDCYESMRGDCGVMIGGFIPSHELLPGMHFPGDVDLLVIPYENNHLRVSLSLAIELKAVRAKFSNQGKSPNQFGFSQGQALLSHGFPFAAVAHLIISDESPKTHWKSVLATRIVNAASGAVEEPWAVSKDMMPSDLIRRSFGRLKANCSTPQLGLLAAYIADDGMWFPDARSATLNLSPAIQTLLGIVSYYEKNIDRFLDTPKYSNK